MNEEIHLRDYLRVINKRRGLVCSVFIVILTLVILGTFAATPQYEGKTQVLIEKVSNNNLTDGGRFNSFDPEFYETQFQLIKSQAVAKRVIEMLQLDKGSLRAPGLVEGRQNLLGGDEGALSSLKKSIREYLSGGASEKVVAQRSVVDSMAAALGEEIQVTPVKNSRLVNISYLSPNADFAAIIANTIAKAYIEQSLNMKMDATRRTLDWMSRKADEERQKLKAKEEEIQAYMRANNLVTVENRMAVLPQKLAEISTALVRIETKRKEKQELYQRVSKVASNMTAAEAVLGLTSNNTLQILRDEILKAEQKVRELSAKYGPKHPVMVKAVGDLDILQSKKNEEIKRLIEGTRNAYEFALASEENLRAQMDRTKAEAHTLNEKSIQYDELKREMETNRQLYDALLLKMKEQSITGETDPVNLWIVEKALVPLAAVKPNKIKNLLLGLIVGLMAGVGLAFFVEYLDNTVKYPEETEKILGLPTLGLVSLWQEKAQSIDRAVIEQPRSAFAECYKALRTAVLLSSVDGLPGRILVTSPAAGAGKTTTAVNLAMRLAQAGKRGLLMDGDLRKRRMHKAR
ncbi:MAG: exopolysaccharide transport family protein, partial [Geopsychrobacter sp.]|nr:exopolysaccharide transport family protein [Geopsychrobacter sp.]